MAYQATWKNRNEVKNEFVDYRQLLTDKIAGRIRESIEHVEKGLTWEKPFIGGSSGWPYNAYTGERYKGVNVVSLLSADFDDERWMTLKQMNDYAKENGIKVNLKKGSKASVIQIVVHLYEKDDNGNIIKDSAGNYKKLLDDNGNPRFGYIYRHVFNASQMIGMPPLEKHPNVVTPIEEAELLSEAMQARTGLTVVHSGKAAAYYSPLTHQVHMPNKEMFKSTEHYYDTLLHEIAHSTGPELKREFGKYGSEQYAFEELVAELSSSFMAVKLGIKHISSQHENQAAYLKSWLKILENDPKAIYRAATFASQAVDYQIEHKYAYSKSIEITDKQENQAIQGKQVEEKPKEPTMEELVKNAEDGFTHDKQKKASKSKAVKKLTELRDDIVLDKKPKATTTDKQKNDLKKLRDKIVGDEKPVRAKKKKSAELVA